MAFVPSELNFFTDPKLCFTIDRGELLVNEYKDNVVDIIGSGVYAWTVESDGCIIPKYIGIFGNPSYTQSLRSRFRQHLGGLNRARNGHIVTPHWNGVIFPGVMEIISTGNIIDIYFGFFDRERVKDIEHKLIDKFNTPWNSRR